VSKQRKTEKAKTGPKEERLKLKGDWQELVAKALTKPRPKGWKKPKK
jgi:hypothetical protein